LKDGPKLLNSLKTVLNEFKPDLVQAGPIQRSAFLVALTGFHPLVTMSWGYDLLVDVNNNSTWRWATRYTLKRSDALVGDCAVIRNLAVHYGMEPNRIVIFPWGIDIEKYSPVDQKPKNIIRRQLGWDDEFFVLVSTRGWTDLYGVEDLAQAFVLASNQRPGIRMLMLGNGPLSQKIREIIQQGEVSDYVHFPGLIHQNKLVEYYRAADLYVSTSHSDGTSISMLEAMSSGIPVLVTDIPGNKEWVQNPGEVGWLFEDGNVEHLSQAILYAYDHRDELPGMGKTARNTAVERANWQVNFPNLFQAYEIANT
jgi:glycosyltransferase involved in cell wall biosynthesis